MKRLVNWQELILMVDQIGSDHLLNKFVIVRIKSVAKF